MRGRCFHGPGVDVLAAAPGRVSRLRDGVADVSVKAAGATSIKGAECGNGVVIDHGDGLVASIHALARKLSGWIEKAAVLVRGGR